MDQYAATLVPACGECGTGISNEYGLCDECTDKVLEQEGMELWELEEVEPLSDCGFFDYETNDMEIA